MHSFRFDQVFPLAVLSPQRGAAAELYVRILKGDNNFMWVFKSNHTSIMHVRFRYNKVLPSAGNDVIVLSPRGGAAGEVWMHVRQERQRLHISIQ